MFGHRYVYANQGFIPASPANRIYCRHLSTKPPGDVVAVPFPYWASAVALSDAQDCGFGQRPVASEEFATDARRQTIGPGTVHQDPAGPAAACPGDAPQTVLAPKECSRDARPSQAMSSRGWAKRQKSPIWAISAIAEASRRRPGPGEPRRPRARTVLAVRPPSAAPSDPGAIGRARRPESVLRIRSAERRDRTAVRTAIGSERASNGSCLHKCVRAAGGKTRVVAALGAPPQRLPGEEVWLIGEHPRRASANTTSQTFPPTRRSSNSPEPSRHAGYANRRISN
jgi:hypothetical protein